jgi:hypothetical protein
VAQLPSPLLLWRYGCRRGRMIGVISSQGMVLVPLLTMHGYVYHVDRASTVLGSLWLLVLPEGSTCPSGEGETCREGSGTIDDTRGLRRDREKSPEMPIVPEASPQGSGEMEFVVCALSG